VLKHDHNERSKSTSDCTRSHLQLHPLSPPTTIDLTFVHTHGVRIPALRLTFPNPIPNYII